MRSDQKNLQDAKTGADPDLTFGYNDLLEELTAECAYPTRQPGDVTVRDLAGAAGLSHRQAYNILTQKVRAGELDRVKVKARGETTPRWVFRKVKE